MLDWIMKNTNSAAVIIAAISGLISALSCLAAFISNRQSKKQYKDSIQPQLTFSLTEYNSLLFLKIKNTGKLPAKKISVRLLNIANNGSHDKFDHDSFLEKEFELYPEEIVQNEIAVFGQNIVKQVFPVVTIEVMFFCKELKKKYKFERTVTYQSAYTEKIASDVSLDTHIINDSLGAIARASVRTANYLDGSQVAAFDELNILANKSLKNDLLLALNKETEPVLSREETIRENVSNTVKASNTSGETQN